MRAVAISLLAVAGCGASDDLSDLEDFMEEVRVQPVAQAHPLPPLEEPETFTYRALGRRSPFDPLPGSGAVEPGRAGASVATDLNRSRPYLERYPVARISMVGTLARGAVRFGLVRVDRAAVYRVEVGDYLGEERGRIRSIEPLAMQLLEIVPDGAGDWVERPRTISLEQSLPGLKEDRQQ